MLRTIEALFVVVIVLGAFFGVIYYVELPSPRVTSSIGLKDLAASTLESLNENNFLTETVFSNDDTAWANLQNSLESWLSPNIMYKLTVYNIELSQTGETVYNPLQSMKNFEGELPSNSETAFCTVTSPNVTFAITPEKIGTKSGRKITLYIFNCEDANGWWTTGYTAQSLAEDIYNIMSPYFVNTILVNTTAQLYNLLNNKTITSLTNERIRDAVIVNTFGEAVPIPYEMANSSFYERYPWYIGQKVNAYNWTWVSIVGYPLYYVTNTDAYQNDDNSWGIYGMKRVGPAGLNGFLQGINDVGYTYDNSWITRSIGVVDFVSEAKELTNFYGVYPETYQTATRALPDDTLAQYDVYLNPDANIFEPVYVSDSYYYAGATFSHIEDNLIHGSFTAIGLARTPDIRISILGILLFYRPNIFRTEFGASGTSRLVMLQLGQLGGE